MLEISQLIMLYLDFTCDLNFSTFSEKLFAHLLGICIFCLRDLQITFYLITLSIYRITHDQV